MWKICARRRGVPAAPDDLRQVTLRSKSDFDSLVAVSARYSPNEETGMHFPVFISMRRIIG